VFNDHEYCSLISYIEVLEKIKEYVYMNILSYLCYILCVMTNTTNEINKHKDCCAPKFTSISIGYRYDINIIDLYFANHFY